MDIERQKYEELLRIREEENHARVEEINKCREYIESLEI